LARKLSVRSGFPLFLIGEGPNFVAFRALTSHSVAKLRAAEIIPDYIPAENGMRSLGQTRPIGVRGFNQQV
jgi:hypothetical protein